MCKCEVKTFL